MTDPARAAVEAWLRWHNLACAYDHIITDDAADALVAAVVAYGAAQRAEEREACARLIEEEGRVWGARPTLIDVIAIDFAKVLRARREGPG